MRHLDLFSGIGGFALAVDRVWGGSEHTFCDIEPFSRAVLQKHWPGSIIYEDIRTLTADSYIERHVHWESEKHAAESEHEAQRESLNGTGTSPISIDLLTGGFPCQPFSNAGARRGTSDDRYLWPEMLRVIREFNPRWIIGENVGGLITWNNGMVLEQVCIDLEDSGYEVQAFVIPAVSVNAPHRRDRVWIVAHATSDRKRGKPGNVRKEERGPEANDIRDSGSADKIRDTANAESAGAERWRGKRSGRIRNQEERSAARGEDERRSWDEPWPSVAARLCRVDDGVPVRLDRASRIKALGNAIVPQVAEEMMRAIRHANESPLP